MATLFGKRLIEIRKSAGLSQAELAQRIGVSDTYISAMETGRKAAPPHAHVQAIAACVGVDDASLWRLALDDREQRLRERLDGIPTASKRQPQQSIDSQGPHDPARLPSSSDAETIARRICELLPTTQDRQQFARSLDVLAEILRDPE